MSLTLHLFGAVHFDRRGKVRDELDGFVGGADADALFVELPASLTRDLAVRGLLRSPAATLGYVLLSLAIAPLYFLFTRAYATTESVAARRVAADRDLPVHRVDRSQFAYAADAGLPAVLANWALLLASAATAPLGAVVTVGYALGAIGLVAFVGQRSPRLAGAIAALAGLGLFGGLFLTTVFASWVVLAAMLAFLAAAALTLGPRDEHMLARAAALADREGYERAVLVTGKAHLPGLVARGADRELTVARAYHPRWLRAPGRTETDPGADGAGVGGRRLPRRARTHPPDAPPGEVASLGLRARAAVADLVVYPVVVVLAGLLVGVIGAAAPVATTGNAVTAGLAAGALLYFPLLEAWAGQTVGKRLVGIAVCDADGTPPALRRALVRNLLRPVDFLVFYLVGAVVATVAGEERRLGDLAAGTVVRRVVPRRSDGES